MDLEEFMATVERHVDVTGADAETLPCATRAELGEAVSVETGR